MKTIWEEALRPLPILASLLLFIALLALIGLIPISVLIRLRFFLVLHTLGVGPYVLRTVLFGLLVGLLLLWHVNTSFLTRQGFADAANDCSVFAGSV